MIRTRHQAEVEAIRRWGAECLACQTPHVSLEQCRTSDGVVRRFTVGKLTVIAGLPMFEVKGQGNSWQAAFDQHDEAQRSRARYEAALDQPCPSCCSTMRSTSKTPAKRGQSPRVMAGSRSPRWNGERMVCNTCFMTPIVQAVAGALCALAAQESGALQGASSSEANAAELQRDTECASGDCQNRGDAASVTSRGGENPVLSPEEVR